MAGRDAAVRPRRADLTWVAALVVGLGVFAVYRATLLPGLQAWDTGEAQTVLPILGTMHPTGFPAYTVIGWLASILLSPLGSPAFTINLLSAILVATAVGLTVVVTRSLRVPLPVGIAAAIGFGLSPIVWHVATAADAHALHAVLLVSIVALLLRWERLARDAAGHPDDARRRGRADRAIVLAAAVFGVAVANHGLTLLLIPAVGLFVLAVEPGIVRRPKVVAAALGACFGVAALFYLELPLRAGPFRAPLVYGHPETWSGFWDVVFARQFQGSVTRGVLDIVGRIEDLVALAFAQYGALLLLVPSGFLVAAVRIPRYALLSGVASLTTCVFNAAYNNAAIERYYVGPAFFAWTWVAILGGAVVGWVVAQAGDAPGGAAAERRRAVGLLAAGVLGVALLLPTAVAFQARWRAVDQSSTVWVDAWLDQAFASMEPNAIVASWWSYSTPLWYGQLVEHRRPDVSIIDDRTRLDENLGSIEDVIEANLDTRPVYLIRSSPAEIEALRSRYVIEPVGQPGNLYRVTGRKEAHA